MPAVDLVDDTFVVASPERIAEWLRAAAGRRTWWPDLDLAVAEDRGPKGMRWTVTGGLVGTAEASLEAWGDGTVVHCYLRGDPAHRAGRRADDTLRRRYALGWKAAVRGLKDGLERGRRAGLPSPPGRAGDR